MSTKTVAEKLSIRPGAALWTSHVDRVHLIEPLPEGVRLVKDPGQATTAVAFVDDAASTRALLAEHADQLVLPATLWIAYPKGDRTDINRDSLWPIVAGHGMRPIGQVAIDDVWSALRFRPLKEGEAPFAGRAR